jgi:hypothetical protein
LLTRNRKMIPIGELPPNFPSVIPVAASEHTTEELEMRNGLQSSVFFFGTVTAKWCHCVGLNLEGPHCTGQTA